MQLGSAVVTRRDKGFPLFTASATIWCDSRYGFKGVILCLRQQRTGPILKISEIEGALIPGLKIKAFDLDDEDEAEAWLAN